MSETLDILDCQKSIFTSFVLICVQGLVHVLVLHYSYILKVLGLDSVLTSNTGQKPDESQMLQVWSCPKNSPAVRAHIVNKCKENYTSFISVKGTRLSQNIYTHRFQLRASRLE